MDFVIRQMQKEDWESVASIYKEGIDLKIATFQSEVPTYEEWDKAHTCSCRFVAEGEDGIIGWIALSPCSSRPVFRGVAEVSIYIAGGYRGKHIGENLMKILFEESEKEGFWLLQSVIMEINNPSLALHKKLGFRNVGYREKMGMDVEGCWQNTVLVERRSQVVGV